jgi:hypothetical protein
MKALPPGWRRVGKESPMYVHDAPPMMFVRRRLHGDGHWWASVQIGGFEWHSYGYKAAHTAMLSASTLAASWNGAEATKEAARDA